MQFLPTGADNADIVLVEVWEIGRHWGNSRKLEYDISCAFGHSFSWPDLYRDYLLGCGKVCAHALLAGGGKAGRGVAAAPRV